MSKFIKMKNEVLQFSQLSFREKLFAGTSGNLSVFDPVERLMAITPSGIPYEEMSTEDISVITLDGTLVEGTKKPSSEWRMHAKIYSERSDICALVHTHSPYATSFAVSNESIPLILIEMVPFLGGDIHVAGFALPGTTEVGTNALAVLDGRHACLLQNHGVLAVGETLAKAHIRAVYVEDAAQIYHFAKCNGNVGIIPDSTAEAMRERMNSQK